MVKDDFAAIAEGGVLRVAINTGNRALVQADGNTLGGVSPALARRLAARLGLTLKPVIYDGAGKVFADAGHNLWDVAFLAIDATPAKQISFTRPYHVIEATYAARTAALTTSTIQDASDADREGVHILTFTGSAYDMYLSANLRNAQLEHSGTPTESFEEFHQGRCELVAGVRISLERHFADDAGIRILPGRLTSVSQAMVLPGQGNSLIDTLDHFVAEAIADGFVASELHGPGAGN